MCKEIKDLTFYVSKFDNKVLTIKDIYTSDRYTINFSNLLKIDSNIIDTIGIKLINKSQEKMLLKKIRTFFYKSKIHYSMDSGDVKIFASYYRKHIREKIDQMYNFQFHNFYIVKCGTKEVKLLKNINTNLPFYRKKIKIFDNDYIVAYNYEGIISDLLKFKKEDIEIISVSYGDFFLPSLKFGSTKIFISSVSKDKSFSTKNKSIEYARNFLDFVFYYFSEQNQDLKWA